MITILLWGIFVLTFLTFMSALVMLAVVLRHDRKPRYPTNVKPPRKVR